MKKRNKLLFLGVLLASATLVACSPKSDSKEDSNVKTGQSSSQKNKEDELKAALEKAKSYDKSLYLSGMEMKNKLMHEEDFSEKAALYAIENVGIDWKEVALEKANSYSKSELVSRTLLYEKLRSFNQSEREYAISKADIDWKKDAIEKTKD